MARLTREQLDSIKSLLRTAPEIPSSDRLVSKQEAVRRLQKEIRSLQSRGYTLKQTAAIMTEQGIPITEGHLRNCLWRANRPRGNEQVPRRRETQPPRASPEGTGRFQVRPDTADL